MFLLSSIREADDLFGKELFFRFTVLVFREHLSICVCSFPFGFEDGMWDLTVLIPDYCLFFYTSSFSQQFRHTASWQSVAILCQLQYRRFS